MSGPAHVLEISPRTDPTCTGVFWWRSEGDFGNGWACHVREARRLFRDHVEDIEPMEHAPADRDEFRALLPFTITDVRKRIPADHPDQKHLSRIAPPGPSDRIPNLHCRCGFVVPSGEPRAMHTEWAKHLELNPVE